MTTTTSNLGSSATPVKAGPPSKHQLAVMIWLSVFPTLTLLNLTLGDWLATMTPVLRTFVLTTIAVPIVIYGLMPQLHKLRRLALGSTRRQSGDHVRSEVS
jgi:antibiotic biosynthesis monooxygenase (ABM) superfamily enzyme